MDYNSVHHQINLAGVELHSHYNDGYVQWAIKQDLHKLKWLLDEILADAPTFAGEKEFLKDHDQTTMWKTLSK